MHSSTTALTARHASVLAQPTWLVLLWRTIRTEPNWPLPTTLCSSSSSNGTQGALVSVVTHPLLHMLLALLEGATAGAIFAGLDGAVVMLVVASAMTSSGAWELVAAAGFMTEAVPASPHTPCDQEAG